MCISKWWSLLHLTQLPLSIKSVSSSRNEVWQDLFPRNMYRLILIILWSFRFVVIDSHISLTTLPFFRGGLFRGDWPSCIVSVGKANLSCETAGCKRCKSGEYNQQGWKRCRELLCDARQSTVSQRVHSRFCGISKTYAEGVRKGKIDTDDSVEKQLYDEKKGTNNPQL